MNNVKIGSFEIGDGQPLTLIAGPCLLESHDLAKICIEQLLKIKEKYKINLVFKSSYEKDNRGNISGERGLGIDKGLKILSLISKEYNTPVTSDIHREEDIVQASEVLDLVQIPAYLCQQTSFVVKAAEKSRALNVKKGQFLAPETLEGLVGKVYSTGNKNLILTERGSCFGYNRLVSDMRSVPIMRSLNCPVCFDAGHIVRIYGIPSKDPRGGEPQFIPTLARAGIAAGADALFVETHPEPAKGWCDAASMLPLSQMDDLVNQVTQIFNLVRPWKKGIKAN